MAPPKRETPARLAGRHGGRGKRSKQPETYSSAAAAATIPCPFSPDGVSLLVRSGGRVFAVGRFADRDAALSALRAVAA
jgi:hypothetical protein